METQRLHDRTHGKAAPTEHAEPDGDEGMEHEEQPIEESVKEHGPVEHIQMHSHHQDGHVHKSVHHDHHSAKHHIDKAFGEKDEMPAHEEGGMGEEMGGGGGIPTMKY
jgi:hypothetical protein